MNLSFLMLHWSLLFLKNDQGFELKIGNITWNYNEDCFELLELNLQPYEFITIRLQSTFLDYREDKGK